MLDEISNEVLYQNVLEQFKEYFELLNLKILMVLVINQESRQANEFSGFAVSYEEIFSLITTAVDDNSDTEEVENIKRKIDEKEESIRRKTLKSKENGFYLYLDELCEIFSLSYVEKQIVVMCIAAELDRKYQKVFGFFQDDLTVKVPTLYVALKILFPNENEALSARVRWFKDGRLRKYLLAQNPKGATGISEELRLDDRVMNYVLGVDKPDDEINNLITLYDEKEVLQPLLLDAQIQDRLRKYFAANCSIEDNLSQITFVNMNGNYGSGRTLQVKHFCRYMGRKLLVVDLNSLITETNQGQCIRSIYREMKLNKAFLAIKINELNENRSDGSREDKALQILTRFKNIFIEEKEKILFILSTGIINLGDFWGNKVIDISLKVPSEQERLKVWEAFEEKYSISASINWEDMASKFKFTPGQIMDALELSKLNALWNMNETGDITKENLFSACYHNGRNQLVKKAVKIVPRYEWEDVILPTHSKSLLEQACNQMRYRQTVFGEWGFDERLAYGKGLSMLFTGPPGTGKTMSAQVVAKELNLELYKIDISQLVSKYIGETEKNIAEIFYEAELSNAILFFDEADALFGKRSEVKDSHDRYSNIEIAYLLQRIEEYEGVSILTTNYLKNIDEAFIRRFNFVIEFPFPDEEYREKIWRKMFPKSAPVDKNIDFSAVAKKIEVSGGNIKNIALSAAFLAAQANMQIEISHILTAAKNEMWKMGKIFLVEDFEEYFT